MTAFRLDRRAVLRGLGVSLGLPWLEIMGCGRGGTPQTGRSSQALTATPKRFVVVYTPNGNVLSSWKPTGSETNFALSPILAPLAPFQSDLLIVDGLRLVASQAGPGDPHQRGMAWLTGQQLLPGDQEGNDGVSRAGFAAGISVDQQIAQVIGGSTKFRSLEFGVQLGGADVMHRMSYLGAGQPLPPEEDPSAAFTRIFANTLPAQGDAGAAILRHRTTVLDAVSADYDRLRKRLGVADRRKLDAHLASIREIESRLGQTIIVGGSCNPQNPTSRINLLDHNDYPAIGRLQMDLLAMSLTCDLTRVASLLWSGARNNHTFGWLGFDDEHHTLSHSSSTDDSAQTKLAQVHTWYSQQFAYLLGKLRAIPEGDGTLLDNTVILWGTEVALGNVHSAGPLPFVLAGRAQTSLRTGRYLVFPDPTPHNNLLVSLLQTMDMNMTTFGKPDACTGPLSGLA